MKNFTLRLATLSAALALGSVMGGNAAAALIAPSDANGSSLFLTVWKTTGTGSPVSYTRDLGIQLNTVVSSVTTAAGPSTAWTTQGFSQSFLGDALFTSTFGAGDTIFWTVTAGKTGTGTQVVDTLNTALSPSIPTKAFSAAAFNTVTSRVNSFVGAVNGNGCSTATSCITTSASNNGFGGNAATWNDQLGTSLGAGMDQRGTAFGTALDFYYLKQSAAPAVLAFKDAQGDIGHWTLASNGTVTYSIGAVPEPASYLLLGAGLVAIGAIARRRVRHDA